MAVSASIREFLLGALREDQRLDGRRPFDSRKLTIKLAREDGAAEVQLGQTHVVCTVSGQLVQPYPDQPNEGILMVHTEFSPMADPTFEAGRPGEIAVELGRILDRGLRESRAIDTESLCVLSGKAVWSLRIDICVLDNGGNLIDASSIAALGALLSFRKPECSIAGMKGQDVVIHPPEVREPLPLIIHYLPIAFTFGFFGDGELLVMDPSYKEELVMRGRLTVTLNIHGDICAIQKGGGIGVSRSDILRCLQVASAKVADVTSSLKKEAEAHELKRAQRKIKTHDKLSGIEDVTLMEVSKDAGGIRIMREKDIIANSLSSSDVDSSSIGSFEDSTSEEDVVSTGFKKVRRPLVQPRLPSEPVLLPWWKDVEETSSGTPARQRAESYGELERSNIVHSDRSPMTSVSDVAVFHKLGSVSINEPGEVGRVESSTSSSSKGKTQSLLDAVKWNNVKKKRATESILRE